MPLTFFWRIVLAERTDLDMLGHDVSREGIIRIAYKAALLALFLLSLVSEGGDKADAVALVGQRWR